VVTSGIDSAAAIVTEPRSPAQPAQHTYGFHSREQLLIARPRFRVAREVHTLIGQGAVQPIRMERRHRREQLRHLDQAVPQGREGGCVALPEAAAIEPYVPVREFLDVVGDRPSRGRAVEVVHALALAVNKNCRSAGCEAWPAGYWKFYRNDHITRATSLSFVSQ
jgi:hypothetical protein